MESLNIAAAVLAEQTHIRLPTRPDWIEAIVAHLKAKAVLTGACHEARAGKLMVGLHEALSNAMIHGNLELSSDLKERGDSSFAETLAARLTDPVLSARRVDLLIDYDGERCQWIITDQGRGFDVTRVLDRAGSDDPMVALASGRGIPIMRSFLDDVRFELNGRRVLLTLLRKSGAEKRQHNRLPLHHPLRIVPVREDGSPDWDRGYDAVSRNISQHGLNLLQEQLNTTKRIIIGLPTGKNWTYIPAEIRHCRALAGNVVEIGCQFQANEPAAARSPSAGSELDPAVQAVQAAVGTLLQQVKAVPITDDERRFHTRVAYNERIEVRVVAQAPVIGFARNLSKGGIAFLTTVALPLEDCVLVLPQPTGPALGLRSRVLRCAKIKEGLYDVGVCFLGLEN